MKTIRYAACSALAVISSAAMAGGPRLYPVQSGAEIERFRLGVPTLDLETATGAIQITPLPFDHGYVSFGVGAYNKAGQAANFGIENISVTAQGETLDLFTSEQLQKKAKTRAMWSQIGVAVLTTAVAAAASTATDTYTYRSHTHTPFGNYSSVAVWRDNTPGIVGATAAAAAGTAGIIGIQNRLDYTLDNLAHDIVQTTTVDPDASYGGRIVIDKSDKLKMPYDMRIVFIWNGVPYPFVFRVTKDGVSVPPPYTAMPVAYAASSSPVEAMARPASTASVARPMPMAAPALSPYEAGRQAAAAAVAATAGTH